MYDIRIGLFLPSRWLITPGIQRDLSADEIRVGFLRHFSGDWGDVCKDDRENNDRCLEKCGRMLSQFRSTNGVLFWVITEAGHDVATMLLPNEY